MRKKLLALLMCATMVLGSSAVAFAAPSADDYTAAEKVFSNGSKITAEYEKGKVKVSVYTEGVGAESYAFYEDAASDTGYSAIKVDSDSKAYLYVGDAVDLTPSQAARVSSTNNLSVVLADYADAKGLDTTKTLAELGLTEIIVNTTDENKLEHTLYVKASDTASAKTIADADTVADYGTATELTSKTIANKTVYYTSDGYAFVNGITPTLIEGITKASSELGSNYLYQLDKVTPTSAQVLSVAKALEDGNLTTDAVAVAVTVYQYGLINNKPYLRKVTTPAAVVSLTLNNDLLSRTGLKASTVDAKYISDTVGADATVGSYYLIGTASSSIDTSEAYKTFSLPITYSDGSFVVIFDKSADASQNDGVNDAATTATTAAPSADTAASSPKTGDVAPIAALAVVMMGACGAMVVASKKRA